MEDRVMSGACKMVYVEEHITEMVFDPPVVIRDGESIDFDYANRTWKIVKEEKLPYYWPYYL